MGRFEPYASDRSEIEGLNEIFMMSLHRTLRIVFIIAIIVAIAAILTAFEALNARPSLVTENDLQSLNSRIADDFALVDSKRTRSLDSLSDMSDRKHETVSGGIKVPEYDGKNFERAVDRILASIEIGKTHDGKSADDGNLPDENELRSLVAWADGSYENFMRDYEDEAYSIYRNYAIDNRSDYVALLGYDELVYTLKTDIIWYRELGSIYFKNRKETLYKIQSDIIHGARDKALSVEKKTRKDVFADLENSYAADIDSQIDRWVAGWKTGKFNPEERYGWPATFDDIRTRLAGFEKFNPVKIISLTTAEIPPSNSAAWLESEREMTKILESGGSK